MSSWIMRGATPHDWPNIAALLATADLPLAGVEAHLTDFFLAFRDDVLIGSAGLERYGNIALLRSVAVAVPERGYNLGQKSNKPSSWLGKRPIRSVPNASCLFCPRSSTSWRGMSTFTSR